MINCFVDFVSMDALASLLYPVNGLIFAPEAKSGGTS